MNLFILKSDAHEISVALKGELDTVASQKFAEELEPLMDGSAGTLSGRHIIMDLKELEYISSSAMRALLVLNKAAMAKGGKVTLQNMSENIRQIFQLTGFDNMFEIL